MCLIKLAYLFSKTKFPTLRNKTKTVSNNNTLLTGHFEENSNVEDIFIAFMLNLRKQDIYIFQLGLYEQ